MTKRAIVLWLHALLCVALIGCAGMQSFEQRAAAGLTAVTASRESALVLLKAQKITPQRAQAIQNDADATRKVIDEAIALRAVHRDAGEGKLSSVSSTLQMLRGIVDAAAAAKGEKQ
ncbi:MAG: hypothetical protein ACRCZI_11205 [Cetobacterium sp.]